MGRVAANGLGAESRPQAWIAPAVDRGSPAAATTTPRPRPSCCPCRGPGWTGSRSAQGRADGRRAPVQFQQVYDVPSWLGFVFGFVATESPAAVSVYRQGA